MFDKGVGETYLNLALQLKLFRLNPIENFGNRYPNTASPSLYKRRAGAFRTYGRSHACNGGNIFFP